MEILQWTENQVKVRVKEKGRHVFFSVVDEGLESLMGDKACEDLKLVRRVYHTNTAVGAPGDSVDHVVQSFADVFKGFGVPFIYRIQLKGNAARRAPTPSRDRPRKELDRMTTPGVIKKVEEPTDWVNSMVYAKKKNSG